MSKLTGFLKFLIILPFALAIALIAAVLRLDKIPWDGGGKHD